MNNYEVNFFKKGEVTDNYDDLRAWLSESALLPLQRDALNSSKSYMCKDDVVRIIEGGVGTGKFALPLLSLLPKFFNNWSFWGIDNSQKMLEKLYKKEKNFSPELKKQITFGSVDLDYRLPFPDEFFHFFILASVLHYLKSPQETLLEISRVMDCLGVIWIAWRDDPWSKLLNGNETDNYTPSGLLSEVIKSFHKYRIDMGYPLPPCARLQYDSKPVVKLLQKNGWDIVAQHECLIEEIQTSESISLTIEKGLNTGTAMNLPSDVRQKIYAHILSEFPELKTVASKLNIQARVRLNIFGKRI